MRVVIAALAVAVCLVTGTGVASAHSALIESEPAADARLTASPVQVVLTFNQQIEQEFVFVGVTSDDGRQWAQAESTVDQQVVSTGLSGRLSDGRYTVAYRVVSADGHPIQGSYNFALTSSPGSAGPSSGSAAAATSTRAATSASSQSGSGSASIWILGAAVGGLLVGGVYSLGRRWWLRKRNHEERG